MKKLVGFLLFALVLPVSGFAATVNLAWDRSPDPNVAGYNVYRATTSGGPYTKLNLMIVPQPPVVTDVPMYSDTTPTGSALTYYYVVRAQSVGGVESANSNEVAFNAPPSPPTNLRIVYFTAVNLSLNGIQVASGKPPVTYTIPRQTPPREILVRITAN